MLLVVIRKRPLNEINARPVYKYRYFSKKKKAKLEKRQLIVRI